MRLALALAGMVAALGCESKDARTPTASAPPASAPATPTTPTTPTTRAALVDLAGSAALSPVRTAFNAHRGEVRFLTLLSPT